MWLGMMAMVAAASGTIEPSSDNVLVKMVTLYDQICLKAFPNDAAVDALMEAKGGKVLSDSDSNGIKRYLHDDPGRGWLLNDETGQFVVTVEAPPYHACSVRRETVAGFNDFSPYNTVIAKFRAEHGQFDIMKPADFDVLMNHSHATGFQKMLADGKSGEALYQFVNTPFGPSAGGKPIEVRFVHQFAPIPN